MAILRKQEIAHNSDEQVREYIGKALELVDELDPPSDLREHVFANAVNLFSAKNVMVEQMTATTGGIALNGR